MLAVLISLASLGAQQAAEQDLRAPPAFFAEVAPGAWDFVSLSDQAAILTAPYEADARYSRFRFEWATPDFTGGLSSELLVEFDCEGRRLRQAVVRTFSGRNFEGTPSGGEVADSTWEAADASYHGQDWLNRHCGVAAIETLPEIARSEFVIGMLQYGVSRELPTVPDTTVDDTCNGNPEFARVHYCVWTTRGQLHAVRHDYETLLAEEGLYAGAAGDDLMFHRRELSPECAVMRLAAGSLVETVEPATPVMIAIGYAPPCEADVVLRQVYRIP